MTPQDAAEPVKDTGTSAPRGCTCVELEIGDWSGNGTHGAFLCMARKGVLGTV